MFFALNFGEINTKIRNKATIVQCDFLMCVRDTFYSFPHHYLVGALERLGIRVPSAEVVGSWASHPPSNGRDYPVG